MTILGYEIQIKEVDLDVNIHVGVILNGKIIKGLSVKGTTQEIETQLQDESSDLRIKIEEKIGEI
jgi:hypothetical protein